MLIEDIRYRDLLHVRATCPERVAEKAAARRTRPLLGSDGRLLIVAIDHPARRILRVGEDPFAMADRRELLERTVLALRRPGVDGLLATPDIVEDLLLLDELDDKVVFGSMNRSGLTGSAWELDDRFGAYDAAAIEAMRLDGGKILLRLDYDDPRTALTLEGCARAVSELAARRLVAMVEPLPARRFEGRVQIWPDPDALVEAACITAGLGTSAAYTWLKLPVSAQMERVLAATSLPTLLLGGDPADRADELLDAWRRAMVLPTARGLVAGRSLLYPVDGDVARWVDAAAEIVHGG